MSDNLIHVSGLNHLTCLKLPRIPAASVQDLVQLRSQLQSLSLVRCTRVDPTSPLDTCLCSSPQPDMWSQLTVLTVSHCNLTCLSPALQYTPYLTHLDCSHNKTKGKLRFLKSELLVRCLRLHRTGRAGAPEPPEPVLQPADLHPHQPGHVSPGRSISSPTMVISHKCYACHKKGGRFELPKDRLRREKWLFRLNIEEPRPGSNKRICIRHFRTQDIKEGKMRVRLKENVLPLHHTLYPSNENQDVLWIDNIGDKHRCHKLILAKSDFLKSLMLDNDVLDEEVVIYTPDLPGSIISLVLDCMYKGEVTTKSWTEYWMLRSTLIDLRIAKEDDLPRLPFHGEHHVGPVLQPPPDWPEEAWHQAKEEVEDLFSNVLNWFDSSKDYNEKSAAINYEKYSNRFSNEEIQNAVLLFNRSRKSYEFLKKKKLLKLPSSTTISQRTSFFQCQPGEVQYHLLEVLKKKLSHLPPWQRKVSLVFDEVRVLVTVNDFFYIFFIRCN